MQEQRRQKETHTSQADAWTMLVLRQSVLTIKNHSGHSCCCKQTNAACNCQYCCRTHACCYVSKPSFRILPARASISAANSGFLCGDYVLWRALSSSAARDSLALSAGEYTQLRTPILLHWHSAASGTSSGYYGCIWSWRGHRRLHAIRGTQVGITAIDTCMHNSLL